MNNHKCEKLEDDVRITNVNYGHTWLLEWNYDDENDPCYGTMEIQYCPVCGEKLV